MDTGRGSGGRTRSPEPALRSAPPPAPKSRHVEDLPDPRREAFTVHREPMDTSEDLDIKRRKKEVVAADTWQQQQQQQPRPGMIALCFMLKLNI